MLSVKVRKLVKGELIEDVKQASLIEACMTKEEWREFNRRSRKMEQELAKAASAGLFLTAADLRDE